jgi:hypothetical protein
LAEFGIIEEILQKYRKAKKNHEINHRVIGGQHKDTKRHRFPANEDKNHNKAIKREIGFILAVDRATCLSLLYRYSTGNNGRCHHAQIDNIEIASIWPHFTHQCMKNENSYFSKSGDWGT